jgi:hypothetical protein
MAATTQKKATYWDSIPSMINRNMGDFSPAMVFRASLIASFGTRENIDRDGEGYEKTKYISGLIPNSQLNFQNVIGPRALNIFALPFLAVRFLRFGIASAIDKIAGTPSGVASGPITKIVKGIFTLPLALVEIACYALKFPFTFAIDKATKKTSLSEQKENEHKQDDRERADVSHVRSTLKSNLDTSIKVSPSAVPVAGEPKRDDSARQSEDRSALLGNKEDTTLQGEVKPQSSVVQIATQIWPPQSVKDKVAAIQATAQAGAAPVSRDTSPSIAGIKQGSVKTAAAVFSGKPTVATTQNVENTSSKTLEMKKDRVREQINQIEDRAPTRQRSGPGSSK